VEQINLRDVFLVYVETKLFFAFARENSPVQPLLVASHQVAAEMGFCCGELLGDGRI
jgi:hypothetical protein